MIPLRDEVPSRSFPAVTLGLIIANVAVFLLELAMGQNASLLTYQFGVIPARLVSDWRNPAVVLTLFSSMYLHGGLMHLLGNMLYLWIFGDNVEDRMGKVRFFIFYSLTGLIAALLQVAADPSSPIPTIGASGAIAGVLGAYLLLYPTSRVRTLITGIFFFRTVRLPTTIVLGGWFLLQLLNGWMSLNAGTQTGGTAWWAHIGGFIAGMLLLPVFRDRNIPPPPRAPYYFTGSDQHTRW